MHYGDVGLHNGDIGCNENVKRPLEFLQVVQVFSNFTGMLSRDLFLNAQEDHRSLELQSKTLRNSGKGSKIGRKDFQL